jgi:hypothetical protein
MKRSNLARGGRATDIRVNRPTPSDANAAGIWHEQDGAPGQDVGHGAVLRVPSRHHPLGDVVGDIPQTMSEPTGRQHVATEIRGHVERMIGVREIQDGIHRLAVALG